MSTEAGNVVEGTRERIRTEVQRLLQRGFKGIEYVASDGPAVGRTPRDVVHRRGTLALYRYRPMVDEIYRVPLLLVMAMTNRGYIFDLAPGQSLVEYLLQRGYDVFVIDWNPPRADESGLKLEDYTQDFIPDSVRRVQKLTGEADVNLVAYCAGGMLSTIYLALNPDTPVKNFATFTTPIDFSKMTLFSKWSDPKHFDVDRLIATTGNMPAELIYSSFDMLRPADRGAGLIKLLDNLWDDQYVKGYRMMARWGADILPLPGEYFRQTTKELMWNNRLLTNELVVGGKRVDLGNIKLPVLHVMAEHDHIVPYDAGRPLIENIGSVDKEQVVLKGGHVSLVAGANAVKRMWPKLDDWLGARST